MYLLTVVRLSSGRNQNSVLQQQCFLAVVQPLSHVWFFATPRTAACQASLSFAISQSLLKLMSIELRTPSNHLIFCHPFSSCPQSFSASRSFQMSQLFASGCQSIGVSASTSAIPVNTQDWSLLGWTVRSPCSPRDSQESSPTPQFKSISSSVLRLLYGSTLMSVHDYWKNHSFDYTDLCQQSYVFTF